jgi:hypothetical protein
MAMSYKNMSLLEIQSALEAARGERSYRGQCQALSWVARNVRDQRHVRKTAEAAVAAAGREEDAYNAVFPLAWPIRALLERGEQKAAADQLHAAIAKSEKVNPLSSRSEALFLLFQGALYGTDRIWVFAFEKLAAASLPAENFRQRRNMRDAILMIASVEFHYAKDYAEKLEDEKLKADVLEKLRANKKQPPRPFFW